MASTLPLNSNGKLFLEKLTREMFLKNITEVRIRTGETVLEYNYNKTRCRILTECEEFQNNRKGILYWMCRDCRVQDNWAMLFAQKLALKNRLPLYVCFFYKDTLDLYPTLRQFSFLIKGLKCVEQECKKLNISFFLINSTPSILPEIIEEHNLSCIVSDFSPLKKLRKYKDEIIQKLPNNVPFVEVDAHNIVPIWITSNKQEIAARTIRSKIVKQLPDYLTGYPIVCSHPYYEELTIKNSVDNFDRVIKDFHSIETNCDELSWAEAGTEAGLEVLRTFITQKLKMYEELRNDPSKDMCSNLSPWLHFGQISAQRCALEVQNYKATFKTDGFLEELIVRRELSDNYCYYNENYDNFNGADNWAKKTLNDHRKDKRGYIYNKEQFKNAETHDDIWNCAQLQLSQYGKIHGYMRMYWCKKILEWTKTPEEAIEIALFLNDTFSIDGCDPNGFVGVMWSICGVHDHGWKEREIFGKIRYMVDYSLRKKFDIDAYCARFRRTNPDKPPKTKKRKLK